MSPASFAALVLSCGASCVASAAGPVPDRAASFRRAAQLELGERPERAEAGRYLVLAAPSPDLPSGLAQRLADLLVRFESAYGRMWSELSPPQRAARHAKVTVYVLAGSDSFRRLGSTLGPDPRFETGGAYIPECGCLAVAVESRLERVVQAALVHEAAHLLNDELLDPGPVSAWLNEGLAQYAQYSALSDSGDVLLGRLDPGSQLAMKQPDGSELVYQFVPRKSLVYLFGQFRRDPRLSLGPLLDIRSARQFYGEGAQLNYARSWTLVHLMAEGALRRKGPLRPYLVNYAKLEQRGIGGRQELLDTLGLSLEDLDSAWYAHCRKLK